MKFRPGLGSAVACFGAKQIFTWRIFNLELFCMGAGNMGEFTRLLSTPRVIKLNEIKAKPSSGLG